MPHTKIDNVQLGEGDHRAATFIGGKVLVFVSPRQNNFCVSVILELENEQDARSKDLTDSARYRVESTLREP